jgi:hypothetical protein
MDCKYYTCLATFRHCIDFSNHKLSQDNLSRHVQGSDTLYKCLGLQPVLIDYWSKWYCTVLSRLVRTHNLNFRNNVWTTGLSVMYISHWRYIQFARPILTNDHDAASVILTFINITQRADLMYIVKLTIIPSGWSWTSRTRNLITQNDEVGLN